jgi:hypothetical protein
MLPPVTASKIAIDVIVPHDPAATGHSIAALFEAVLPVTVNVTDLRTYAPVARHLSAAAAFIWDGRE